MNNPQTKPNFISKPLKYFGYYFISLYTACAIAAEYTIFPSTIAYDFSPKPLLILFAISIAMWPVFILIDKAIPLILDKLPGVDVSERNDAQKLFWIIFGGCVLVFSFFLYRAYPGTASPDTLTIADQVKTGKYTDLHPIFYTFWFIIANKIRGGFAGVAIFQILFSSFIIASIIKYLYMQGFNKRFLFTISAILLLIPSTGWLVVTLWKDIPYSVTIVYVGYLLYAIQSDKCFLSSIKNIVVTSLFIALIALFRHNGILPLFLSALYLMVLFYIRKSKNYLGTALLSITIYYVIHFGLIFSLNVAPQIKEHHMVHLYSGPIFGAMYYGKESQLLPETQQCVDQYRSEFDPGSVLLYRVLFAKKIPYEIASKEYFHLLKTDPLLVLRTHLNRSITMWHMVPDILGESYVTSHFPGYRADLWRLLFTETGFWIVVCLFFTWFMFCQNVAGPSVSLIPALGNAASLVISMQAQEYRYIWSIFLSSLLFLLFVYNSYKKQKNSIT